MSRESKKKGLAEKLASPSVLEIYQIIALIPQYSNAEHKIYWLVKSNDEQMDIVDQSLY